MRKESLGTKSITIERYNILMKNAFWARASKVFSPCEGQVTWTLQPNNNDPTLKLSWTSIKIQDLRQASDLT